MSRRDQLVEQMSRSIRENGVGATTVEHVLGASKVTAGSMYHFFPDGKEALVVAAVERAGVEGAVSLASVMESAPTPAAGTEAFYAQFAVDMEEQGFALGCPVGVPSTEAAGTEAVRAAGASAFLSWIAVIASVLEAEGFSPARAQSTARFAVAAYEGASTVARTLRDTAVIQDTMAIVKDAVSAVDG